MPLAALNISSVQHHLLDEAERAAAWAGLELRPTASGLSLAVPGGPAIAAARELLSRPRPGSRDLLWRAVLAGQEDVVDATAGLGADAFHLAAKGARVTLIERSPVLAALLDDALTAAGAGALGEAAQQTATRLRLVVGEAVEVLDGRAIPAAGVVYLDPMFTAVSGSAAPPKGMAVLRRLLAAEEAAAGPETAGPEPGGQEAELLRSARAAAGKRVVVKRGLRAEPLAGVAPSGSLRGRTVRYDLYAPR